MSDLRARNIIDYVPGQRLEDLTVARLVDLAQRTVQGPRSFSKQEASGPGFAHQIFLNPSLPADVLFSDWDGMRCWSVEGDRLFWEYEGHWSSRFSAVWYDAEVTEGGRVAMIAVAVAVVLGGSQIQKYVDIVHLDLVEGTSFSIFLYPVPLSEELLTSPLSVKICGDFALVQMGTHYHEELILLKLSTRSSRRYSMTEFNYKVLLIPGYMILLNCEKGSDNLYWELFLHVWNIDSLMTHPGQGRHEIELKAPPLIHQSIMYPPGRSSPAFFLSAHASPLRRGHYTLWLACPQTPRTTRSLATINKYDVSLQVLRSQEPSLQQLSSETYDLPGTWFVADSRISYSGHVLRQNSAGAHRICWLTSQNKSKQSGIDDKCLEEARIHECPTIELQPFEMHGDVQLSGYGGTLTFWREKRIAIEFYE